MGMWSYCIPEFDWDFTHWGKQFEQNTKTLANHYDVVFLEDGGNYGSFKGNALPILYHVIDSTLSDKHHYQPRYEQAKQADLILVDHDRLDRFTGTGKKVVRFEYAVNEKVFKDYGLERSTDVAFHCGGSDERALVRNKLHDLCSKHGWVYTSGVLPLIEYAKAMNRAKIVVNWPRTEGNRPHRVFDAMACRSYLVTSQLPARLAHTNSPACILYSPFMDFEHLEVMLEWQLETNSALREELAQSGHNHMMQYHTWAVRAQQLRELVNQEFGL